MQKLILDFWRFQRLYAMPYWSICRKEIHHFPVCSNTYILRSKPIGQKLYLPNLHPVLYCIQISITINQFTKLQPEAREDKVIQ